jgi:hypothetical protein
MRSLMRLAAVVVGILQIGCSVLGGDPKPDHFGIFVVDNGKLTNLFRLTEKELNSRSGSGTFTVMPTGNVLRSDAHLYFIMYGGFDEALLQRVVQTKGRYETKYANKFDMQVAPVKGEDRMLRFQPVPPLKPGLYELSVAGCSDNNFDGRCYLPIKIE